MFSRGAPPSFCHFGWDGWLYSIPASMMGTLRALLVVRNRIRHPLGEMEVGSISLVWGVLMAQCLLI